jgi:hypothetical protein
MDQNVIDWEKPLARKVPDQIPDEEGCALWDIGEVEAPPARKEPKINREDLH